MNVVQYLENLLMLNSTIFKNNKVVSWRIILYDTVICLGMNDP